MNPKLDLALRALITLALVVFAIELISQGRSGFALVVLLGVAANIVVAYLFYRDDDEPGFVWAIDPPAPRLAPQLVRRVLRVGSLPRPKTDADSGGVQTWFLKTARG